MLFGGETLQDFGFALLVGVASGAYSSIFIAAPVLTHWKEREPVYVRRTAAALRSYGGVVPPYADGSTFGEPSSEVRGAGRPSRPTASSASGRRAGATAASGPGTALARARPWRRRPSWTRRSRSSRRRAAVDEAPASGSLPRAGAAAAEPQATAAETASDAGRGADDGG